MPVSAFNLIGGAYSDDVLPLAAQECINWYPETVETEGGRNVIALKGSPGLESFGTVTGQGCRGMHVMNDVLFAVYGQTLYRINGSGGETEIGTVEGTGRVGMASNASQLVVVTGSHGYVYDSFQFAVIGDQDFQGAYTVAFLDSYGIFDGQDGQFFISALENFDEYDALDFATAEASPDRTIAVLVDHLELWVFGTDTIEVWQNTGNADFPFERNSGVVIERGLGARYSAQKMDNTVYWLGDDWVVYAAGGYIPQRISTHAIEQDIQSLSVADRQTGFAFTYRDKGHWFYVLTFPNGKTWIYDAAARLWHRRKSYGFNRWRANAYAFAYGKHLIGDADSGTIWEMRSDLYAEGDQHLVAERKTQYGHANQQPMFHRSQELVFESGVGLITGQGSAPLVELCYSDDGGRTWSNWKQRSLGAIGRYANRVRFQGLGRFTSRVLHIRISDPVKRNLIASTARYEVGSYT